MHLHNRNRESKKKKKKYVWAKYTQGSLAYKLFISSDRYILWITYVISFLEVNDDKKSDVLWQKIHTDENEHLVYRYLFYMH